MKIIFVVNVDWFFLSHRLPIALGALKAGHDVHLATTLTSDRARLESYGLAVHPVQIDRSSAGPLGLFSLLLDLIRIFWRVKPDVVHLVTIKPVLIGGLAARLSPVRGVVYAISGLGHVFIADGILGALRRRLVGSWYRLVLGARNSRIIFQNPDDRASIESVTALAPDQVVMIPGSGVDLSKYQALPLPNGVPVIMMVARLLATKGVEEFVSAAQSLRESGASARFWLVGEPDLENPASIQPEQLEQWKQQGHVELLGHRTDIADLMAKASLVVLPSYREGFPKVLIEAAACGRAVVTTDVPGCRDAIDSGVTGVMVPARDAQALAAAIKNLIDHPDTCERMGRAGRYRAERIFDINAVVKTHLDIYRALETSSR